MSDFDGPRFTHDCDRCVFLARVPLFDGPADAYVCPQFGHPTIVFRQGDDGPDYSSSREMLRYLPPDLKPTAKSLLRRFDDRKWASDFHRKHRREHRRAVRRAGGEEAFWEQFFTNIPVLPGFDE